MNRIPTLATMLLLATASLAMAQPTKAAGAGGGSQEQRSLEALRRAAKSAVQNMEAAFETDLKNAVRQLRHVPVDRDTDEARDLRIELSQWASVFPERFAAVIKHENATPDLQSHFCQILALSGSAEAATALAGMLGSGPDLDLKLVRALAYIPAAGDGPRAKLVAISKSPPSAEVLGATIVALARLGHDTAPGLARKIIADDTPAPHLIASAIRALAITQADPRGDLATLRKLGQQDNLDKTIHIAVLRALGKYERNTQSRRLLHEALEIEDKDIIEAALDGLETTASKESSRKPMLDLVKNTAVDRRLRERSARMMMSLGLKDGVRVLVDPYKSVADKEPRNATAQRDAAVEYKRLGDYDDAINYFERAARRSSAARRYEYRVWIARCRALMGQFDKAAKELKNAGYTGSLKSFADDADFKQMREDPKYAARFVSGGN